MRRSRPRLTGYPASVLPSGESGVEPGDYRARAGQRENRSRIGTCLRGSHTSCEPHQTTDRQRVDGLGKLARPPPAGSTGSRSKRNEVLSRARTKQNKEEQVAMGRLRAWTLGHWLWAAEFTAPRRPGSTRVLVRRAVGRSMKRRADRKCEGQFSSQAADPNEGMRCSRARRSPPASSSCSQNWRVGAASDGQPVMAEPPHRVDDWEQSAAHFG